MPGKHLLAIDQGTTNSRAIIFDHDLQLVAMHEISLRQSFPQAGWVEQDAEEMFDNSVQCCKEVLKKTGLSAQNIAGIGISNQRETTIIWDKQTGKPIYPAIVWQDRRTSELCNALAQQPIAKQLQDKTGLLLDPYFSATKIMWILNHVPTARTRANNGELLFGTVDCYLLWRLTEGKTHATDITNAARTLLFNIRGQHWDNDILTAFNIPKNILPIVLDNSAHFGETNLLGSVPISVGGMAGDQQAAAIGQACFKKGAAKITFGTGGFLLLNTSDNMLHSSNELLTTVAYRVNNNITYALEGGFFAAGVSVKWLRDTLHLIKTASETETLAEQLDNNCGVYLIPAFTGLGAPYWEPNTRAAVFGLSRDSGPAHFARAALESVAYQTRDLLEAVKADFPTSIASLHVDGGMAANNWLLQFLANILNIDIVRPECIETTALGAACLAGLQAGMYSSLDDIAKHATINRIFKPQMGNEERERLYSAWKVAVGKLLA